MIDLHCHYLPAIDDGSPSMADSLELARAAVADGITHAAMTPHIHSGRYDNTRTSVEAVTVQFRKALKEANIPLQIFPAGEVRLSADIIDLLDQDEMPFLGTYDGFRVVLLEFPYAQIPLGTEKLVRWLLANQVRPLIAHPERNKAVMQNVERIAPYVSMGCMMQVTAASLVGGFGPAVQECAELMLDRGWISLVASDAHNMEHRNSRLTEAYEWLVARGGELLAENYTNILPSRILGLDAGS